MDKELEKIEMIKKFMRDEFEKKPIQEQILFLYDKIIKLEEQIIKKIENSK